MYHSIDVHGISGHYVVAFRGRVRVYRTMTGVIRYIGRLDVSPYALIYTYGLCHDEALTLSQTGCTPVRNSSHV